jgi:hypothetical protein
MATTELPVTRNKLLPPEKAFKMTAMVKDTLTYRKELAARVTSFDSGSSRRNRTIFRIAEPGDKLCLDQGPVISEPLIARFTSQSGAQSCWNRRCYTCTHVGACT